MCSLGSRSSISVFEAKSPIVSKTISEIELSDDCRNAIQEIGIETIGDLDSKTEIELLEQNGFTQAFVDEINNQLDTLGLKLHSGSNVG